MDSKEPIRDRPELLSLPEPAKLLGMSPQQLLKRAAVYGAIRVGNSLKFFNALVVSPPPPEAVGL